MSIESDINRILQEHQERMEWFNQLPRKVQLEQLAEETINNLGACVCVGNFEGIAECEQRLKEYRAELDELTRIETGGQIKRR